MPNWHFGMLVDGTSLLDLIVPDSKQHISHSTDTLYVPDGYIGDPRTFQAGFLDWLYHNPDYLLCDEKGHAVYHYDAATVLEYINQEVLQSGSEKAYFVPEKQPKRGRICTPSF